LIFRAPVVKYLKIKRVAESQEFKNEIAREWFSNNRIGIHKQLDSNKLDEEFSNIESEKEEEERKYNKIQDDIESCLDSAEDALAGNDDDLLKFYDKDNKTKNHYLVEIYDPGKMDPPQEW